MNNKHLLFRPKLIEKESFCSYIQRVAKANIILPSEIWRLLVQKNTHYPQSSFSHLLNIYPNSTIDVLSFEEMLLLEKNAIENLTFIPLYKNLWIEEDKIAQSRLLSGMLETHQKYCPKCIKEHKIYKLIWQVKEISFCDVHGIELENNCWQCNKNIPLLHPSGQIGLCPYCNADLSLAKVKTIKYNLKHRIYEDWEYLLERHANNQYINFINLTAVQLLSLKLLFIRQHLSDNLNSNSLLQTARNSKMSETNIHLSTILKIIREANVTIEYFINLKVPNEFIEKVIKPKHRMIESFSCLSPWCKNYKVPGSLKRTATSSKTQKDGTKYNFYMYCPNCSISYSLTHKDKRLGERGYFISMGWHKIRPLILEGKSITETSMILDISEDKIKRSIIFMASNKLIHCSNLPLAIPTSHDKDTISLFKDYIKSGVKIKEIRRKLSLSYNDFLYYWFYTDIQLEHIRYIPSRKVARKSATNYKDKVKIALNFLIMSNIPITVEKVCSQINVSHETLRNQGLLEIIKDTKKIQMETYNININRQLLLNAEHIINEKIKNGEDIISADIYNYIGACRTSLSRRFPEITMEIHQMLKNTKT